MWYKRDDDGSLELIHKSFDDFLRDHGRCGDGWFIDVKEHEKELARRCVLSLTMFLEKWMPCYDHLEKDEAQHGPLGTVPFQRGGADSTPCCIVRGRMLRCGCFRSSFRHAD